MELEVKNLSFGYKNKNILKDVNLRFQPMITALIGPNGAGKSTIIKCISGIEKPKGELFFDGKKIQRSYKEFYSDIISYLPQSSSGNISITVLEAVLLGMINTLSIKVSDEQLDKVRDILCDLGIQDLAEKKLNELSGGQRQIVFLAQAIIKEPKILILDEPLNNLDIHYQFEILNLISRLSDERELITIIVMHDLNMAAKYAKRVVLINEGEVLTNDKPDKVLTTEIIRKVYNVESEISKSDNGILSINFINTSNYMQDGRN